MKNVVVFYRRIGFIEEEIGFCWEIGEKKGVKCKSKAVSGKIVEMGFIYLLFWLGHSCRGVDNNIRSLWKKLAMQQQC